MDKLQRIAGLVSKINPMPILDEIEARYGKMFRDVVIAVVILAAVVLGYNMTDVLTWLGVQ